mgnify:CR=1 FL=1
MGVEKYLATRLDVTKLPKVCDVHAGLKQVRYHVKTSFWALRSFSASTPAAQNPEALLITGMNS